MSDSAQADIPEEDLAGVGIQASQENEGVWSFVDAIEAPLNQVTGLANQAVESISGLSENLQNYQQLQEALPGISPENINKMAELKQSNPELVENFQSFLDNNPALAEGLAGDGDTVDNESLGQIIDAVSENPENTQQLMDKINQLREDDPEAYNALVNNSGVSGGPDMLVAAIENPVQLDIGIAMAQGNFGEALSLMFQGFGDLDFGEMFGELMQGLMEAMEGLSNELGNLDFGEFFGGDPELADDAANAAGADVDGTEPEPEPEPAPQPDQAPQAGADPGPNAGPV